MAYIYSLSDTWNAAGTTFTGIGLNVTDTASAAGSLLMDLQVGGVSKFSVTKSTVNSTVIQLNSNGGIANIEAFGNSLTLAGNGGHNISLPAATFQRSGVGYGFFLGTGTTANSPVLYGNAQEANHTIAQRNGVNAQTFRVYNTFTDASNYERGKMEWSSNVLRIGTEKAGTGTARALELQTDGTTRMTISASANIVTVGEMRVTYLNVSQFGGLNSASNGVFQFRDATSSGLATVQFGGTTSSFPALKRSTTSLQARLADDSAFTNIQGKLTTDTAYTAGVIVPTGYITLYDSTGTAYRVPCVV
jgi:hypothetical protein